MIQRDREHQIDSKLILDGDWACALADDAELLRVCRAVARADDELSALATSVAEWANVDIRAASHYWGLLAVELRRRCIARRANGENLARATAS